MVKLLQLRRTPVMSLAVFGVSVQPTIRMIPDYAAPRVGNLGGESLAAAPGDLSADHVAAAALAEPASALGADGTSRPGRGGAVPS
jgi:hypothetical protein